MRQDLEEVLANVVDAEFGEKIQPQFSRPDEKFGDWACNVALQLAGKIDKNPREIAEVLAAKLREALAGKVSEVSIAGPGFLNFRLADTSLWQELQTEPKKLLAGQKIVIETNNPNPFKDMHIGHAFNSILADTVANLLAAGGGEMHRVSYHGDVGLHVGKSMWAIMKFIDGDASKLQEVPESERPKFLSQKYAEGAAAYEQDDLAKQEIEQLAKESFALENNLFRQVYEICKAWSFDYFEQIFESLGSQPIEKRYLESQADAAGREVVEQNTGQIFERSDGAVIFPGEKYGLHTRVFISSRGTTLYEARDLGLMKLKQQDFSPSKSYIVTAAEQKEYFRVVLKAADMAMPELAGVTQNISTGTVKLATGKMSSRMGTFINIGWLFNEIEQALKARGASDESLADGTTGALRYTMLKNRMGSDVVFDVDEAISLEGNSGPYLQYAHARARSILSKVEGGKSDFTIENLEAGERTLVRKLSEYSETVELAVNELMPHHICTYLYELAQSFNRFYEHNRVIGDERETVRLKLVEAYAKTLKTGLELLGIPAPDKM